MGGRLDCNIQVDGAPENRSHPEGPCNPGKQSMSEQKEFSAGDLSRIIEMAWQDLTPFEALKHQYGLSESDVGVAPR